MRPPLHGSWCHWKPRLPCILKVLQRKKSVSLWPPQPGRLFLKGHVDLGSAKVLHSSARSLEPSTAGAARLEPEPVCWATAQSHVLGTLKSGFCLLWKVSYFLWQKRDVGEAPSHWYCWHQNGEKKTNCSSRFTFYLVCAVFCHLIRYFNWYVNSIKNIISLMIDSFKSSFVICKSDSI